MGKTKKDSQGGVEEECEQVGAVNVCKRNNLSGTMESSPGFDKWECKQAGRAGQGFRPRLGEPSPAGGFDETVDQAA